VFSIRAEQNNCSMSTFVIAANMCGYIIQICTQIHRYCLKIYPKMCYKIILRQKL